MEGATEMPRRVLPSFNLLWSSYPTELHPCDQAWANQCAIRMSISLIGAGFPLTNYNEPRCRHNHARGAEALASYLWNQVGPPKIAETGAQGRSNVLGKTGLVFFKDLPGFRGGVGDHFDLWINGQTKTGEYFDPCKQSWFWQTH
jgi:hypothetical protein